jgi:hypothetical protein
VYQKILVFFYLVLYRVNLKITIIIISRLLLFFHHCVVRRATVIKSTGAYRVERKSTRENLRRFSSLTLLLFACSPRIPLGTVLLIPVRRVSCPFFVVGAKKIINYFFLLLLHQMMMLFCCCCGTYILFYYYYYFIIIN